MIFKREIYFNWDNQKPRPFQVLFFGTDGRRVLKATLGQYKPIPETKAQDGPAVIPTDITLEEQDWPGRTRHLRRLHLSLSEMNTATGEPAEIAKFWDNLPPELKSAAVDIDAPPRPVPTTGEGR